MTTPLPQTGTMEKFLVEVLSLALNEPVVAAVLVIAYLHWTTRYGTVAAYFDTLSGLVAVVIALAEEVDGVDEGAVHERFNGGDSNEFMRDDTSDPPVWKRD